VALTDEEKKNKIFELDINVDTGVLVLENEADNKYKYKANIKVTTSDGLNVVEDSIVDATAIKVCGPASTTLIKPILPELLQAPDLAPPLKTEGHKFVSSNPRCPVTAYTLHTVTSNAVAVEALNVANVYTFEATTESFGLTMADGAANPVDKSPTTHEYKVKAVAEGGHEASVTGKMHIEKVCVADINDYFKDVIYLDIPKKED
jgi:hypothetical protein